MSWDDSTYNWSEMQQEASVVLEGEFPLVVIKAEAVKSANGKDMIKAQFKIESGTYAGRKLFSNFVISPESSGAMRMFFSQLAVFGLDAQFFASIAGQPPAAIASALDGRKAIGIVGKNVYQGTEREEIKGYKPALGGHGGGSFVAGLGTSIGAGVASSSPLGQPSASSYNSPIGGAASGAMPTSAPTSLVVAEPAQNAADSSPNGQPVSAEPSTAPPAAPAF